MLFLFMNYFEWDIVECDFQCYFWSHLKKSMMKFLEVYKFFCRWIKNIFSSDIMRSCYVMDSFQILSGSLHCSWLLWTLYNFQKLFRCIDVRRFCVEINFHVSVESDFQRYSETQLKKIDDENFRSYKHFLCVEQKFHEIECFRK